MAKVAFRTKGGKKVEFTTRKRKGKRKRKVSAYNRFVAKAIRGRKKGTKVTTAMKQAAKAWKKRKK